MNFSVVYSCRGSFVYGREVIKIEWDILDLSKKPVPLKIQVDARIHKREVDERRW